MFECHEEVEDFVAGRIAQLRTQKGVSARDMSLTLGLGVSTINNIENKSSRPSIRVLYYICEFFKISLKDFFDEQTASPALLSELTAECSKLDGKSLTSLLEIVKTMKK